MDRYAQRYRQIEAEELPRRYARIAERSESIADQMADLEEELLEQMRRQAPELAPRDTAGALRNVTVAKAVNLDKSQLLRGRPTEITATADVTDLLKRLAGFDAVEVDAAVLQRPCADGETGP